MPHISIPNAYNEHFLKRITLVQKTPNGPFKARKQILNSYSINISYLGRLLHIHIVYGNHCMGKDHLLHHHKQIPHQLYM